LTASTAVVTFGDRKLSSSLCLFFPKAQAAASDGWQLGEHDTWAKMTNFEVALRTPLIIRAPWMKASIGQTTSVLAEAVDFYPTLAALVGLPAPKSAGQQINGTSLVPAFDDPEGSAGMKDAAYSQFAKPSRARPFVFWPTPQRNATEIMGYTVRVDEWRYTCWFGFDGVTQTPNRDEIIGRELCKCSPLPLRLLSKPHAEKRAVHRRSSRRSRAARLARRARQRRGGTGERGAGEAAARQNSGLHPALPRGVSAPRRRDVGGGAVAAAVLRRFCLGGSLCRSGGCAR